MRVDTIQRILDMPNKPLGSLAQHISFQLQLIENTKADAERLLQLRREEIIRHEAALERIARSIREVQANCSHLDLQFGLLDTAQCHVCGATI